ncbi:MULTISPECIES: N-acetylneuraminate synthase [unclassified Sedimentibacter]|uniref:N-acetylneuraminate synthase n=1 Tax=unclassified Sedimentibacter TaxID=2649220 RepID=UPI0027E0EFEB|nr:N-acetylneuraminate synthase [Sedimentibacter sp. MB35-C1]WMJ78645.1 N-acetylneuraminate synthase [Sedimentibacter sp. MB35-C1]
MSAYIIAEAGVNHNGKLSIAKLLVDKAKQAGADCIKFQTFVSENIVTKNATKADYQKQLTNSNENQLDMLRKLELSFDDFIELYNYCKQKQIEFLSTAFDLDSIDFLNSLGIARWKIPSGDITNLPYLIKIAKLHKPIILSTGMSTMDDIRLALKVLKDNGNSDITVLHCTSEYPAPYEDINLKAMLTIKNEFNIPVGYSDHTMGIEIPIAAVAMGAEVIEKHFTLDRDMIGPDHKASLQPDELKAMITAIRNVESAIGTGEKKPAKSEMKNINIARKSIIAKTAIKKGDLFTEENITVKRPGNGISPMRWFNVLGRNAKRNFEEDELIEI